MADPLTSAIGLTGGKLIGTIANASAARKKNSALTQGYRQQGRTAGEAAHVAGDFMEQLRGTRTNPAVEQGLFSAALGPEAISGPGGARFRADARGMTNTTRGYGGQLAELFARIRAPQIQQQRQNEVLMNMGNALRPLQQQAAGDDFLTQLRVGAIQPNPWLSAASGLLQRGGK